MYDENRLKKFYTAIKIVKFIIAAVKSRIEAWKQK